jgi:hypothetical protein
MRPTCASNRRPRSGDFYPTQGVCSASVAAAPLSGTRLHRRHYLSRRPCQLVRCAYLRSYNPRPLPCRLNRPQVPGGFTRLSTGRVQAFSRGGHDWSDKYGRIVDACGKLRCRSALIDGEVIVQDRLMKGRPPFRSPAESLAKELLTKSLVSIRFLECRLGRLDRIQTPLHHLVPQNCAQ